MKQVLQHLRTGELEIADVPTPRLKAGYVLIQTQASLISAGTERMLVDFGKANLLQKARSQPEKVKQVLEKLRTDGIVTTAEAVLRKLDQPLPLGYSNAGVVVAVGDGIHDLQAGDRVASNGQHAEMVCVPRQLCARIPEGVSEEQAAFTTLGSIALQGLRLAQPTLGETFVVFGVGLLGLLTVQLLRANGCAVIAVDLNSERLAMASSYGAEIVDLSIGQDPVKVAHNLTWGRGADGVLITASARSDELIHQAAEACRKRGRIILVGVIGLHLRRSDFYEKELTFQVSCSYGPGRYDPAYEQKGQDYPLGFVRWTETRNFEAILQLIQQKHLDVDTLISQRFPIHQAHKAYEALRHDDQSLGLLLTYNTQPLAQTPETILEPHARPTSGEPRVALIGAGQFALSTLLPALKKSPAFLDAVVDHKSFAAQHAAKQAKARRALTDDQQVLEDPLIDAVFYVTGHHLHARQVCQALRAKKHVFVEKPLALNEDELQEIIAHVKQNQEQLLMVGLNRRFSPHIQHIKQTLRGRTEPLCMQMTINAGAIPPDHWTQDPSRGGGRIIGEACHFIDLLSYLAESPITAVSSMMVGKGPAIREDKMSIMLQMQDGSIGTVHYFANGTKSFPKETLEVFSDQRVIRMNNYRETTGFGFQHFKTLRTLRQDKGHAGEIKSFVQAIQSGQPSPIPFTQLVNITRASFAAVQAAQESRVLSIELSLEPSTQDPGPPKEPTPTTEPQTQPPYPNDEPRIDQILHALSSLKEAS